MGKNPNLLTVLDSGGDFVGGSVSFIGLCMASKMNFTAAALSFSNSLEENGTQEW
jgi:hypothetical protein